MQRKFLPFLGLLTLPVVMVLSAWSAECLTFPVINTEGQTIGNASVKETPHGVLVTAQLSNITPGEHAVHIHEAGICEPPEFKTAGGHFNPAGHAHGYMAEQGYHAGDLPNAVVKEDGRLMIEYFTPVVSLDKNAANSLFDANGAALVVHASADDYQTNPAGNAGPRIACGVIVAPRNPASTSK